ncbi:hypothetical protein B0H19DRAFT_1264007 [Mycena capillaripes]|nr:hypothetical protein B0H19DRAFT_1264007 [Mycena capillaripes]
MYPTSKKHPRLPGPAGSPACTFLQHIHRIKAIRYFAHQNDRHFNEIAVNLRFAPVRALELTLNIIVDAANEDAYFRTGFVTAFPHVTRLVLACSIGGKPAPLIDMICRFPALQELHIRPCKPGDSAPRMAEPVDAEPPRGLRSLHLSVHTAGRILAWLHASNHLPSVDSLTLPSLNSPDDSILHAALQQLGSALYHLDTTFLPRPNPAFDPTAIVDLSLHPNLKKLTLRGYEVRRLLSKLAAPRLERLFVDIWDLQQYDLETLNRLDEFLSSKRFPSLHSVVLRARTREDGDILQTSFPLLQASGVLQVGASAT